MNDVGVAGWRAAVLGGLAILALVQMPPATAANHALVVGASDYPSLEEAYQLKGPRNDAELVREFLLGLEQRPFPNENVEVLADGLEGAERPTRGAILAALERIAERAGPGDFVYLHFSGHGSRAPARDADSETDGLDELFLPVDIGQWDDAIGAVDNALVDDELGERVAAIRERGAFVWAVFDSCHSGTVTRGAPVGDGIRQRKVEPAGLGIPTEALDEAAANVSRTRGRNRAATEGAMDRSVGDTTTADGGFVAFYAAQSTQTTPEMRLPAGRPGRRAHGLFTFTLMEVLAQHPGVTYRQLGQEILHRYAAERRQPTPLFEGDLDAPVYGVRGNATPTQWSLREAGDGELRIPAGELHGLSAGMHLLVVPSPTASNDEAVGAVEVVATEPLASVVAPLDTKDDAAGDAALSGDAVDSGAYARLAERGVDFRLRVARPDVDAMTAHTHAEQIRAALEAIDANPDTGLRVEWVAAGEAADLRLAYPVTTSADGDGHVVDDEHLWLLPPSGEVVTEGPMRTPSIRLADKGPKEIATALTDSLARIARVTNLLRLSKHMGPAVLDIDVRLRLKRAGGRETETISAETVPDVHPGDEIHITVGNPTPRAVDVNVLFVGSDYSITHMAKERIHGEGELRRGLLRVTDTSFGAERVVVIASPAREKTEVQDLRFLAQASLPRTRGRDETQAGLGSMLREAGFGHRSRGAAPLGETESGAEGAIIQFTVQTQPSAQGRER